MTRDDEGSISVLAVGFTAVLLLAVAVVVDVSAVLLARRSAASAADGAAVAAAQALDEQAFYAGGAGERVPLSPSEVSSVVAAYGAAAATVQPGLVLAPAVEGGTTAVVTATRTVRLPFSGWLGQSAVEVTAVARARAPVAAP